MSGVFWRTFGNGIDVIYLERIPSPPLSNRVRMLWYAQAPEVAHKQERILPNGCVQLVINLGRDFIGEYEEGVDGRIVAKDYLAPSLLVGARSVYEVVASADMADVIGAVFRPDGFAAFAGDAVDRFSNLNVSLEDLWGVRVRGLRDHLREATSPNERLQRLEDFLLSSLDTGHEHNRLVRFALHRFAVTANATTVNEVAADAGWSARHFSQTFREHVGLSPKTWCRIQRFQQAVRQLHAGADVRWAELAVDCGYYDQSHFANEFRAFSGIDATTYSARRTQWANHIPIS